ncbi:MAG: hypothetical protein N2109_13135 [Fimbriimonadales bacterium]|nr:hypothetical protein [Fimbriimonadales bacterium]
MEALEEPVTDPITGETIRPSDPHRRCGRCGARYTEASYRYVLEELGGRCQACRGYLEPHTGPSPDPSDVEDFFATEAERRLTREPRRRRSRRSAAARRNDPFDAEESALERGWGLLVDPTAPRNRQEALMILGLFEDATPREILDNYILLTRAWRSRDREEARDIVRMYLAAFDRALRFLMNNP